MGLSSHLVARQRKTSHLPRRRRKAVPPPPVLPGARVGVAALSGPVDAARLEAGLAALRALGFEPVEARNLRRSTGLFAGDDRERLEAFHALAADPSLRAIVFARGGHGVLRVLQAVDWQLLGRVPRAYVGYSDLTPLLLEIVARLGLIAFHGPMVAADLARGLEAVERADFLAALGGSWPRALPLAGIRGGAARGRLLGGCLSLLTAVLGSRHAPDLRDAILVIEEIDEPRYRLDRMLTQLRLSGSLKQIRALVFGHLTATGPRSVEADWQALAAGSDLDFEGPVAWGLPVGHQAPNLMLPLGGIARLDPQRRMLIVEPAASRKR